MTVAPVRNPIFITQSDGTIRNIYDVRLLNKYGEPRLFQLSLSSDEILKIDIEGTDANTVLVPADTTQQVRVYVSAGPNDPAASAERTDFRFWAEDLVSGDRTWTDTHFNGKVQ
jgi:polyferredoxin